ncbi:M42 family metallopeptidase [Calorimonas adulescens]|jgi:M42 glutamyl aminopeptidase.|uniref:M42 family metallopeptidase n=1 Tax=Calorimonas adulescens TaxID=2606906 RepID=A0A5D8QCW3_9THEO|nr:M42 family metallopeptidase [Calorimonas adulescens]TZE81178.1 M42 family metallopeptidase [Calorimonas adulescens]
MEVVEFLSQVNNLSGIPGYEKEVSGAVAGIFREYCDEVDVDRFYNVIGKKSMGEGERPRVMLAAHMDEVGMMVTEIDDRGFIKFTGIGIDQRILPGQEVRVHGKRELLGIIGAKPPHLQKPGEADKAVDIKDMAIDVGMGAESVRDIVRVGDPITFKSPVIQMNGSFINGKSLDDRAGVAVLLEAMKELDRLKYNADVYFVATTQEELGSRGAKISTYALSPDVGIAIDVTHGDTPDAPKERTYAVGRGPAIGMGPNMHPVLTQKLIDTAKEYGIDYQLEVMAGHSGTDAWVMQVSREGVPTVLVSIPLRYMHTTVETLNVDDVKKAGRLIALFIASLKEGNEWLNY